ncbi:PLP-dependent transferase [Streptomyces sp. LHD-70]|uniref:trans-sulfuration enzyme family protein n=1 Tax=Streptomyces sp. LHD-70 TaxID=3072140 RepID=UPI00281026E1|nr:PLP-dependent transferase [Streptomyces sp. LHD-70]MDQ8701731.1 PLP-dependent transferase [Streptomyces sp. LHD-70]
MPLSSLLHDPPGDPGGSLGPTGTLESLAVHSGDLTRLAPQALETAMADLEDGAAALATATGAAALDSVLACHLRPGEHVIAHCSPYGGSLARFRALERTRGVRITYVSGRSPGEVAGAIRPTTRMLYLETLAGPLGDVCDLPAMTGLAREAGLITVVDNTFASPMLCRPLHHGADIVLHSSTAYIGGHTDVTGGILVFADERQHRRVRDRVLALGETADPFTGWLTLRGLRTLPLRMRRHCENAGALARRLAAHPAVAAVHWPGLPGHPSHRVATRLLGDYGGLLAFDIARGRDAARQFTDRVTLAQPSTALGGMETLVHHPTSSVLRAVGASEGTVRVSVGIENPGHLWSDFVQALPSPW